MTAERVNHPDHYNANPSGVECIDVVEHLSFNVGNAIKYLWRAGHKGNLLEDLRKAAWYVQREIERLESSPVVDGWHRASELFVAGHSSKMCTLDFCGRERE